MSRRSLILLSDIGVGNDKAFTVPANTIYKVCYCHAKITTTGTAGNRQFDLRFQDDSATPVDVLDMHPGIVHGSNDTTHYVYIQGTALTEAKRNNGVYVPLPIDALLLPGWRVNLIDDTDTDVLDVIDIHVLVERFPA